MERLTKYSNDIIRNKAINIIRKLSEGNGLNGDELAAVSAFCLIERTENKVLKGYEDLEEQGKLLKLPCAVGDTVYAFRAFDMAKVVEFKVDKISWFTMDGKDIINVECLNTDCDCFRKFTKEEFGKTVFLTHEAAKAALKELRKE